LDGCPGCLREFKGLSKIWNAAGEYKKIDPPPYLWKKILLRIDNYENRHHFFPAVRIVNRYAIAGGSVAIVLAGIFLGIFLGSGTDLQSVTASGFDPYDTEREEVARSSYLDSFDNLPPKSLGGVYIALLSNNE